jgi:Tol biopolymer transport system component
MKTDQNLEERLRDWYLAEIDDRESAPLQLRAELATFARTGATLGQPLIAGRRWPSLSRFAPLALAATAVIVALLIGIGLFVRLSPEVGPSPIPGPTDSATSEPDATASPGALLGGGLILVNQSHQPPGPCSNISPSPFDVYALDPGTGASTLLGTVGGECRPRGLAFQWAPDRVHILMTDEFGQQALTLDAPTAAGRDLTFICCNLPTDVWQGGSSGADGWVLSPAGDRVAAIHTSEIQYPNMEGPTSIADGIVVSNIDGSGQATLLLPTGADIGGGGLSWSPDQSAIVVAACLPCDHSGYGELPTAVHHQHLYVVPVDGSAVRELLDDTRGSVWGATWSSDGSTFAAVRSECQPSQALPWCNLGTTNSIELVDVADGTERTVVTGDRVTGQLAEITAPIRSRGGAQIAFSASSYAGAPGVFVIDADGTNLRRISDGSLIQWSPDGEWLLLGRATSDGSATELSIMRVDRSEARGLGTFASYGGRPAW